MNFLNSMAFTAITFVAFTALVAIISWWKTRRTATILAAAA
mgnify:CR=1 FL=1